jgi:hypothetical protein
MKVQGYGGGGEEGRMGVGRRRSRQGREESTNRDAKGGHVDWKKSDIFGARNGNYIIRFQQVNIHEIAGINQYAARLILHFYSHDASNGARQPVSCICRTHFLLITENV